MSPSVADLFGADPEEKWSVRVWQHQPTSGWKWTVSGTAGALASSHRSHATSAEAAASAIKLFPEAVVTVEGDTSGDNQ